MGKYINYLKYLAKHKYFYFKYAMKMGIYVEGITHDWDKILIPPMFHIYAVKFDVTNNKPKQGSDLEVMVDYLFNNRNQKRHYSVPLFNIAQQTHYLLSPHHPEHYMVHDGANHFIPTLNLQIIKSIACDIAASESAKGRIGETMFEKALIWFRDNKKKFTEVMGEINTAQLELVLLYKK